VDFQPATLRKVGIVIELGNLGGPQGQDTVGDLAIG
jgi:hypothetical protein